jgi:hydroxymethylpyrimidine/phosphomethylpyrimidine kinase
MQGRVLVIAGSDSGGGAGIQADIKAITALNGYAMTAITALTAQNTLGVHGVHSVPPDFVVAQMTAVVVDLGIDAVKTGMLGDAALISAVADTLEASKLQALLVVDPVMVAKGGAALLAPEAIATLKELLLPRADVLTPNIPEAEALTGLRIQTQADVKDAGYALLKLGAHAVLMKGGHLPGAQVEDWLITAKDAVCYTSPRLMTRHTHGTGCTLASALACGLAQGLAIEEAVARARAYVWQAIANAPGFGAGHGPLNHAHCFITG